MEEAYSNLNNAYLQIKGMIVVEGFYALVAGFVITTFVFKLAGIIKEMVHEGKGFNAKQFYELGREYILCIALICIMPVLLDTLETVLAYAADRLMESLAAGGVYNPDNIWKKPIEQLFDDLMNSDIIDIAVIYRIDVRPVMTAILRGEGIEVNLFLIDRHSLDVADQRDIAALQPVIYAERQDMRRDGIDAVDIGAEEVIERRYLQKDILYLLIARAELPEQQTERILLMPVLLELFLCLPAG